MKILLVAPVYLNLYKIIKDELVAEGHSVVYFHILKWEFSKLHPAFYDRTYSPINTALHKTAMP